MERVRAQETGSASDARRTMTEPQAHAVAQIRTAAQVATPRTDGPMPTVTANVAAKLIAASGPAVTTRVVHVFSVLAAAHRVTRCAKGTR